MLGYLELYLWNKQVENSFWKLDWSLLVINPTHKLKDSSLLCTFCTYVNVSLTQAQALVPTRNWSILLPKEDAKQ